MNKSITIKQKKINNMPFLEVAYLENDEIQLTETYRPTENQRIYSDILNWLEVEV